MQKFSNRYVRVLGSGCGWSWRVLVFSDTSNKQLLDSQGTIVMMV